MLFVSTRGGKPVTGAEAIVKGMADGGGLYVPASFPAVTAEEFSAMLSMDYAERTAFILGKYLDEYDGEGLLAWLRKAYAAFEGDPAPLVRMDEGLYLLELFHGPTCAFKDMALAVLPYLLREGCNLLKIKKDVLVLAATSGDTGKAALEAFADKEGVKVMVFYPEEGVSKMQKLQMCTQDGENVNVVAVRGNFDDCQAGVKRIFRKHREELADKVLLTSANSISIGRLLPQIAYYFSAYCDLVTSNQIAMGDPVDFCVPTGNFGNVLAGYYAKRMGLPVGKLLTGSNKNCALADLFKTGTYDVKRPFWRTMSPSMDILLASNLERLFFELSGRDESLTTERMRALSQGARSCTLRAEEFKKLNEDFFGDWVSEDDTVECVYDFFEEYGYPMDTHTGVAMCVAERYREKVGSEPKAVVPPTVVIATASPYKFPQDVLYALTGSDVKDSFKGIKRIHLLTAMKVPEPLKAVRYKPIRFKATVPTDKMYDEVLKFIG